MKTVCLKKGLPKGMPKGVPGLLLARDLSITNSRLKAKLMVFEKPKDLRAFWKNGLKPKSLGRHAVGAVQQLKMTYAARGRGNKPEMMVVDPRYFCLIGLCRTHLSMEAISHEAVHAGYAFALRKMKAPWFQDIGDMKEEEVAYPAGRIAAAINRVLHKEGLYQE